MKKFVLVLGLSAGLSGCGMEQSIHSEITSIDPVLTEVPSDCVKFLSSSERSWFQKFQKGNFLVDGWKDRTEELLGKTPFDMQEEVAEKMMDLGYRIGCEWSRDNSVRRIDNDMLESWGGQIRSVANRRPNDILDKLNELYDEVIEVLGGF